jgi:hypothetical protein
MLMGHHNLQVLELLRGNVSIAALDLLVGEIDRMQRLLTSGAYCGCHLFTTCRLLCACRLNNYFQTAEFIDLIVIFPYLGE